MFKDGDAVRVCVPNSFMPVGAVGVIQDADVPYENVDLGKIDPTLPKMANVLMYYIPYQAIDYPEYEAEMPSEHFLGWEYIEVVPLTYVNLFKRN